MSRILILLALLLAGSGDLTSAVLPRSAGARQVAPAEEPRPAAWVLPHARLLPVGWQETTGPGPGPVSGRTDRLGGRPPGAMAVSQFATGSWARSADHCGFGALFALERAGHASFHVGTPPPLRFV